MILLLTLTMCLSVLDQNHSHFADEKAEAQRDWIPSQRSAWQSEAEAGLSARSPDSMFGALSTSAPGV